MMRRLVIAAVLTVMTAAPSLCAAATMQRLSGTIVSYGRTNHLLTVKTTAGAIKKISLLPKARIIGDRKATVADITKGDFVASAAMKAPDGKLYAQEMRIFPPALRGMGEGQYPMSQPHQSMTNATVIETRGVTASGKAGTIALTFHGTKMVNGKCEGHASAPGKGTCIGKTAIIVRPGIPVTYWILGNASWLKPGLAVRLFASPGPKGTLVSPGLIVEHNGVMPQI